MPAFDVVLVDDEVSFAEIVHFFVLAKYKDWRFTTFSNPDRVYDAIVNEKLFSTVWIVDMMMPGKSGAQIAEVIRARDGATPIVLGYSALDIQDLRRRDHYCDSIVHFNRVVSKTEDLNGFLSMVNDWVKQE